MMERSLKSASPPPPQEPQRSSPPLPQVDTQLSPIAGAPPCRTARVYTIEDILGRPQSQESTPQGVATDSQVAGEAGTLCATFMFLASRASDPSIISQSLTEQMSVRDFVYVV